jgi:hypothetical protein
MLILLIIASIISSVVLCVYTWKLAGLKKNNSEYIGLFLVGFSSIIMIGILSAGQDSNSIIPICGVIIASFSIKSKLFHRELMILNTLKRGIESNKAA